VKKDIEIPISKDVYVVAVHDLNEAFTLKEWNAYILNDRATSIEMVMIVSKGYDNERKTSVMRHAIGTVEAKSSAKIELILEDVLSLTNEFFVTYYADSKFYEKRFLFEKDSVTEGNLSKIDLIDKKGIMAI
jgi:hypothetical protein